MKVVAHGGGDRHNSIKHALELTGCTDPKVLLIPSSSVYNGQYDMRIEKLYSSFDEFGIHPNLLHDFAETPSTEKINNEIGEADMLYTIGGNSPHMLKTMRQHGSYYAVRQAIIDGKVHAGTSAGALLPFEQGHSNPSPQDTEEEWDFTFLPMMGVIKGVATAHADKHDNTPYGPRPDTRMEALIDKFPTTVSLGFAIDNDAALAIDGNVVENIRSAKGAKIGAKVHLLVKSSLGTIDKFEIDAY